MRHFDETFWWDIVMAGNGWKIVHSITRLVIKLLICTTGLSNIPQRVWHWLPWPCFVMPCTKPPSTNLKLCHILEENYRYPPNCMGNAKKEGRHACKSQNVCPFLTNLNQFNLMPNNLLFYMKMHFICSPVHNWNLNFSYYRVLN